MINLDWGRSLAGEGTLSTLYTYPLGNSKKRSLHFYLLCKFAVLEEVKLYGMAGRVNKDELDDSMDYEEEAGEGFIV